MPMRHLAAALLAAAVAWPAPAEASATPPLGLKQGQGAVGIGAMRAHVDVAVLDRVTVGWTGWTMLFYSFQGFRAGWTAPALPGVGPVASLGTWGAFGFLGGDMVSGWGRPPYSATYTSEVGHRIYGLGVGYESPRAPVMLRASLMPGLRWSRVETIDGNTYGVERVVLGVTDAWDLNLYPNVELLVPIGEHVGLVVGGGSLAAFAARW